MLHNFFYVFRYDTSSETLAVRIINIRNIPKNNKEVKSTKKGRKNRKNTIFKAYLFTPGYPVKASHYHLRRREKFDVQIKYFKATLLKREIWIGLGSN